MHASDGCSGRDSYYVFTASEFLAQTFIIFFLSFQFFA